MLIASIYSAKGATRRQNEGKDTFLGCFLVAVAIEMMSHLSVVWARHVAAAIAFLSVNRASDPQLRNKGQVPPRFLVLVHYFSLKPSVSSHAL